MYNKLVFLFFSFAFFTLIIGVAQTTDVHHQTCKDHKASKYRLNTNTRGVFKSNNSISDSVDIIKYTINLDATDFTNFTTRSSCTIEFTSLVSSLEFLPLDLKGQTVDSVIHASGPLFYVHEDEKLTITLDEIMNTGELNQITIYYHGGAIVDPSGFGGFYFNSDLAYNIGVAFSDIPHNYGRVWFPCVDNFVEKSIYEFQILAPNTRAAYCNGHLVEIEPIDEFNNLSTWLNNEEIPSYLASVAVSTYQKDESAFLSISGDSIPVFLVAKPVNLPNLVNAFINLENVFHAFENWFGAYRMEKVGYVLTPVGAMEHSTNIAFPVSLAGGGSQSESVMAHELAHEWFGNLVTCKTAQDMWLNEGWAEYLSILVYEVLEGQDAYRTLIRNNHKEMLHTAHYVDGGFLTMNDIPLDVTYGEHVYNKGADLAHTLRGYLGDELFFPAMQSYLNEFEFKNASSIDFRDYLNSLPGINVNDYFNDWIFQPGWTQFSIDNIEVNDNGSAYDLVITVNQRLRYANTFYNNVPVTLSLWDENLELLELPVVLSGESTVLEIEAPFSPILWTLNRDEKISFGVTASEAIYESTGIYPLTHSFFRLTINNIEAPSLIRVEQNWAGPGGLVENNEYIVSPDRYWRVDGIIGEGFEASGRIDFDGRNTGSGNLDPLLLAMGGNDFNEQDIVVLYRESPNANWQNWQDISVLSLGDETDGYARITINSLPMGEYTFGLPNPEVSVNNINSALKQFELYPNPCKDHFQIKVNSQKSNNLGVMIYELDGRKIIEKTVTNSNSYINVSQLSTGNYIVEVFTAGESLGKEKLMIVK